MKVKGIKVTFVFLILALVLMPFPVFADTQIVPTFSSSTSQWSTHMSVTNYCQGTNTQASCKLKMTFDDDYYGYVYFTAYNNNTKLYDFQMLFVAGGYGEYDYLFYQNGVLAINKVDIDLVHLATPQNLDLTTIETLLTAIQNNQLTANSYLQILYQLRNYSFPIESLSAITTMARNNISKIHDLFSLSSWTYPVFQFNQNDQIMTFWSNNNQKFIIILYANQNMRRSVINNYISFDYGTFTATDISSSFYYNNSASRFIKIEYTNDSGSGHDIHLSYINSLVIDMVPIFISDFNSDNTYNVSSDFALNFGLSNQLLNDLHIVAQGTQQSDSAASGLESSNTTMASDMNSMATIENGYSQDFNSQLQNIDFTNPIQQNQGILPAANFVISIFNGLISNNPFTVLIIIVCILLIGKKVIGK